MNLIALTGLLFFGTASAEVQATDPGARERAFVHALELFDAAKTQAEYRESAAVLETILADGFRSGAAYYNLGNAYFRAGDYGRAILNFRRAKPYRPRDPYLTANLEQALKSAPGRLTEPLHPWWTHVLFWTDWISYPVKVAFTFTCSSLAAVAVAIGVMFRWPRGYVAAVALLIVGGAVGVDSVLCDNELTGPPRAVITGETIARKGTGSSYEAAFDQPLRDGAEFQILNETADWTFGHFEGIGDGWVRNEFVAR